MTPNIVPNQPDRLHTSAQHSPNEQLPVVLTITETYQLLRISRWLLYEKYIHTGRLRTLKIGHRRLVPLAAVRELLERSDEEVL